MGKEKKVLASVKPRGAAIERTDEEIGAMTSADAMEELAGDAADDWRENSLRKTAGLLDTEKKR